MRFGIVYYGAYPWNRGIDQLGQSLRVLGHDPLIVAKSLDFGEEEGIVNGVRVIHVPPQGVKALASVKSFHLPFNLFWRHWLIKIGKEFQLDGMIVRETPLSWAVLSAARKLRIPAYLDMRENLGAMYNIDRARNFFFRIMRHSRVVKFYEEITIRHFNHIFAVSPELKNWLITTYTLHPNNVSVLENTPNENYLNAAAEALQQKKRHNDLIYLAYSGWASEKKGIGDIVSSLPYVLSKCPNVRLRIIGEGPAVARLKMVVNELEIGNKVEFFPMLSMSNMAKMLTECDIGIESSWLNELTHQTTPGKLFEYMAVGLAILSSARRPVVRVLEEVNCGKVYFSRNPQRIADCIVELISNRSELSEMGRRARQAVLNRYNWRINVKKLKSVIKDHQRPNNSEYQ